VIARGLLFLHSLTVLLTGWLRRTPFIIDSQSFIFMFGVMEVGERAGPQEMCAGVIVSITQRLGQL
jgi:hypothetical protein